MPDDNRFAGLSEAVEDDDDAESDDGDAPTAGRGDESEPALGKTDSSDPGSNAPEDGPDSSEDGSASSTGTTDVTESDDPAAFPFDATEKKTVYVRPETIADLDDARALVDAQLRTEHDVRDLTGREFYNAVFRLAAADTEGLIDEILEARQE